MTSKNISLKDIKLEKIIKKCNENTKQYILDFARKVLGETEENFEEIWSSPIISSSTIEQFLPPDISEEDTVDFVEAFDFLLLDELGESDAVLISLQDLENKLKEPNDYYLDYDIFQKFKNNIPSDYFISYSESNIYDSILQLLDDPSCKDLSLERIERAIIKKFTPIFIHERCHQTADRHLPSGEILNGCAIEDYDIADTTVSVYFENSKALEKRSKNIQASTKGDEKLAWRNRNELFIELLSHTIIGFSKFQNLDEAFSYSLHEISSSDYFSSYLNQDKIAIPTVFALHLKDFCHWGLIGARKNPTQNLIKDKYDDIFALKENSKEEFVDSILKYLQEKKASLSEQEITNLYFITKLGRRDSFSVVEDIFSRAKTTHKSSYDSLEKVAYTSFPSIKINDDDFQK